MYDLQIQIINYNTKKYLEECLSGLFYDLKSSGLKYKVLVLDNNSEDDLSDSEKRFSGEDVSFYYSKKNLGFGGGHNFLSEKADCRYILILNSDLKFIQPDTVKSMYDRLIKSSEFSVIGPMLVVEDLSRQEFDHGELTGIYSWVKNNYGSSYWKPRDSETEAAWVSGAVFMCDKSVFKKIGGFDEKFFLYKEEEDLCKRIREAGYKILYYPETRIMHIGHVVARRSAHFSESMDYYIAKHFENNMSYKILNTIKKIKDISLYGKVRSRS